MAESLGNRLAQDRGPKSDGRRTDMNSPSIVKSVPVGLLVSPVSGRLPNTRSDSRLPFALLIRITRPETLPTQTSSSLTSRRFDARLSVTSRAQREYPYVSKEDLGGRPHDDHPVAMEDSPRRKTIVLPRSSDSPSSHPFSVQRQNLESRTCEGRLHTNEIRQEVIRACRDLLGRPGCLAE